MIAKIDLKNLSEIELESYFEKKGEPKFRAQQLIRWLYKEKVSSFHEMTNFSKSVREALEKEAYMSRFFLKQKKISQDGTLKFLFELEDEETIETVLMPYEDRNTLCISTQVGCRMGCTFCLTAKQGLKRQLKASEILNQVIEVEKLLKSGEVKLPSFSKKDKITNVVMMGMGEAFDNFDNVLQAIHFMTKDIALELAPKRVTVSTSGLVPKIKELGEKTKVNLAVSLNASHNKTRSEIMPVNKPYPIEKLIQETKKFSSQYKQRKVMLEYVMMKDVNDTENDALELVKLLKGSNLKVNLIPFNEHSELSFKQSSLDRLQQFQDILHRNKVFSFIRWSKGRDVSAACGQLRSDVIKQ
ncbi:MAG: 23S rRNA (adenine(2503)-C(2))-methyltransferase RlmN [Deltaproteobacteria bacterium]|nr:23S rRNA (adenine(2503)-C(2))-methyltransferase RlmN [Deltaproteobacteria bacterium]